MRKIMFVLLNVMLIMPICAQNANYTKFLQNAEANFMSGDYVLAKQNLEVYQTMTNVEESELMNKIVKCIELKEKAEKASISQVEIALEYYKLLLTINPQDEKTASKIAEIERQISEPKQKLETKTTSVSRREEMLYVSGVRIYQNGKRISDEEVCSMFVGTKAYDVYDAAQRTRTNVNAIYGWFETIGALTLTAGSLMQLGWDNVYSRGDDYEPTNKECAYAGLGLIGGGLVMMLIPPIVEKSVQYRMKKAVRLYNASQYSSSIVKEQTSIQFSMHAVPNGIGMRCTF